MNNFFILYYGKIIGCNTAKYMIYCSLHCRTTILCISDWIFFTQIIINTYLQRIILHIVVQACTRLVVVLIKANIFDLEAVYHLRCTYIYQADYFKMNFVGSFSIHRDNIQLPLSKYFQPFQYGQNGQQSFRGMSQIGLFSNRCLQILYMSS